MFRARTTPMSRSDPFRHFAPRTLGPYFPPNSTFCIQSVPGRPTFSQVFSLSASQMGVKNGKACRL